MDERIYKMLCIAEDIGHKNLIFGAWGCGIFGNKPENVEFAILPGKSKKGVAANYSCFAEKFMQ